MKNILYYLLIGGAWALFTACSSSDGDNTGSTTDPDVEEEAATAQGRFVDAAVAGLTVTSSSQSGETDKNGVFTYEPGQPVIVTLGGIGIGIAEGDTVISPLDLVDNGSIDNATVINIVQFLMMLDEDGTPGNGISISDTVKTVAEEWMQPDFTATDFENDNTVVTIVSDVASVDDRAAALPADADAADHVSDSLLCAFSGGFHGTWSGDGSGAWSLVVSPTTGSATGYAIDDEAAEVIQTIAANSALTLDSNREFTGDYMIDGVDQGDLQFNMPDFDSIEGSWQGADGSSGSLTGQRAGAGTVGTAVHRISGVYGGDGHGLFVMEIAADDSVNGVGYSAEDDETATITGDYTPSTGALSGSFTGTGGGDGTISADYDAGTGTLSGGSWSDGTNSGTFSGAGCLL